MIQRMLAIWSGSSAFSKTSLNIWKFLVHVLLKPGLENFEHYFNSMWDECICVVVWAFFGIAFLWDWNENWTFPILWPLLSFPNFLHTSVQFSPVAQSCPTLCDPMNFNTPGLPVHHQLPEFTQTQVHRVGDAIQPSHTLLSPSPSARAVYSQQKQDLELTVAQIMNSLLPNSDLNWTK